LGTQASDRTDDYARKKRKTAFWQKKGEEEKKVGHCSSARSEKEAQQWYPASCAKRHTRHQRFPRQAGQPKGPKLEQNRGEGKSLRESTAHKAERAAAKRRELLLKKYQGRTQEHERRS